MKSVKRRYRRHHLQRVKQQVKYTLIVLQKRHPTEVTEYLIGLHAHTRKLCSCPICGNRRKDPYVNKWEQLSKQEKISEMYWNEMKCEHY